jgi:hypothetical protein
LHCEASKQSKVETLELARVWNNSLGEYQIKIPPFFFEDAHELFRKKTLNNWIPKSYQHISRDCQLIFDSFF